MKPTLAGVVVFGVLALTGCGGGAAPRAPMTYRGGAHGVDMTLRITPGVSGGTLTVHFGAGTQAIRGRALQTRHLEVACVWPIATEPGGAGGGTSDVRLDPTKRTQSFTTGASGSTDGYTCALSAHRREPPVWPGTAYIRRAIVAVHLHHTSEG